MEQNIKDRVIGVEISVKRTSFAIVDIRGNILAKGFFPTNDYETMNDYVAALCEKLVELAEANGGYETIRSIGVSAPSANFKTGCIVNSPNLPWKGVIPLAALMRDRLGIAVAVGNDAYVTALGERAYGVAHGMKNFIVIALGHGIGSSFFTDGIVHTGTDGFAGEVGHVCIKPNGRECGCGRKGCLEAYCAGKGIIATARELMEQSDQPSLMRSLEDLTPLTIEECCEKGDELAIEVFRITGRKLGVTIADYATILNPEAIIFTGGIANAGHWLFDPLQESFDRHVFKNIRGKVKILRSKFNSYERDMLGASALAWGIKEYSLFK